MAGLPESVMIRILTIVLLIAILLPGRASSQEQTLLGEKAEYGWFLGPVVKFSSMVDEFAVMPGLRGGWIINHAFSLGLGGYGLANDIQLEGMTGPTSRDIDFGYGGLELEYINSSNKVIHFTISTLVGGGGVTLPNIVPDAAEAVFVLEPMANLVLNVAPVMRVEVGVGYRWVTGTNSVYYDSSTLSSVSGGIALLFGKF
jgi:hypothetical protein